MAGGQYIMYENQIYIVLGATQSGKTTLSTHIVRELYDEALDPLRGTPDQKDMAEKSLKIIADKLYDHRNEIFDKLAQMIKEDDAKFYKENSNLKTPDKNYYSLKHILERSGYVSRILIKTLENERREEYVKACRQANKPADCLNTLYPYHTEEELKDEWLDLLKKYLILDKQKEYARTTFDICMYGTNKFEDTFKNYLISHFLAEQGSYAFVPKKKSSRKRRLGEDYTINSDNSEAYDLNFNVGIKFSPTITDEYSDKIFYSSKLLDTWVAEGKNLVIPTGSLEFVKYLFSKYPKKCKLIGNNMFLRGYGDLLKGECNRYGIKYNKNENLEQLLSKNDINVSIVKNRFYNQFMFQKFFNEFDDIDSEYLIKNKRHYVALDKSEWLDNTYSNFNPITITREFREFTNFVVNDTNKINPKKVIDKCDKYLSVNPQQILDEFSIMFNPNVCPYQIPFNDPRCMAILTENNVDFYSSSDFKDFVKSNKGKTLLDGSEAFYKYHITRERNE